MADNADKTGGDYETLKKEPVYNDKVGDKVVGVGYGDTTQNKQQQGIILNVVSDPPPPYDGYQSLR